MGKKQINILLKTTWDEDSDQIREENVVIHNTDIH